MALILISFTTTIKRVHAEAFQQLFSYKQRASRLYKQTV